MIGGQAVRVNYKDGRTPVKLRSRRIFADSYRYTLSVFIKEEEKVFTFFGDVTICSHQENPVSPMLGKLEIKASCCHRYLRFLL